MDLILQDYNIASYIYKCSLLIYVVTVTRVPLLCCVAVTISLWNLYPTIFNVVFQFLHSLLHSMMYLSCNIFNFSIKIILGTNLYLTHMNN